MIGNLVLGEPKRLEVRIVRNYLWVARATKPAPLPKFLNLSSIPNNLTILSTTGKWVAGADFAIIVLTDPKYPFHLIDAGRAIQNMQLTAWSMDVGSCIYTGVREIEMKKEYGIPEGLTIAAVVGFGYPKKKIKSLKNRRRLSEVAFSERFGEKLRLI